MAQYSEFGYSSSKQCHAHEYILPVLLKLLQDSESKHILDVGCGNGSLAVNLMRFGYDVYGIDASEQGIAIANQASPGRFFIHDVNSAGLPEALNGRGFDTLISIEVIEHLYNPRGFVRFCKDILLTQNGGGYLILSTPYHGYLKNLMLAASGKFDGHFTALWDGGHIKFWSRKTLCALLEEAGFQIHDFRGAGRIPYLWKSMMITARI